MPASVFSSIARASNVAPRAPRPSAASAMPRPATASGSSGRYKAAPARTRARRPRRGPSRGRRRPRGGARGSDPPRQPRSPRAPGSRRARRRGARARGAFRRAPSAIRRGRACAADGGVEPRAARRQRRSRARRRATNTSEAAIGRVALAFAKERGDRAAHVARLDQQIAEELSLIRRAGDRTERGDRGLGASADVRVDLGDAPADLGVPWRPLEGGEIVPGGHGRNPPAKRASSPARVKDAATSFASVAGPRNRRPRRRARTR